MFAAKVLVILCATSICFGFVVEPRTSSDTRIVGGMDAAEGQFPWMISLRTREDNQHQCGGSILNSKWFLTAAHCFYFTPNPEDHIAVIGSIFLSAGTVYNISRYISHKGFNPVSVINDVAVAELAQELEFNEFLRPIELNPDFVGEVDCLLSGWGRLYFEGPLPDNLQYIHLRTITLEECRQYPNLYPELFVSDEEICTRSVYQELGFCNGDSGGPLVADGKQIGIVSWGNPPCAFGQPEMFARVSSFIEWINSAINS